MKCVICRIFNTWMFALLAVSLFGGGDWLQFRGNDTDGNADDVALPTSWTASGENIAWTADLKGRGLSTPIVIGDRVVVTSSSGFHQDRLHVTCFDAHSGEQLWERQSWATGRTMCHPKMCNATPTPASDGERIFATYSSNDVICLDLDGNLLWFRGLTHDYPNASNSLGMASSPVVMGNTLIVQVENDAESFSTGLDVETGEPRWKLDRPQIANWASPTILRGEDREDDLVLLQSPTDLQAVHPQTGEIVWTYTQGASGIPSSVAADGTVFVPSNGLTALRTVEDSTEPQIVWQSPKAPPSTASPIYYNGRIFVVTRAGVLLCINPKDGEEIWKMRVTGPFSSTPLAANGYIYLFNEMGLGYVVRAGETEGEQISENDLQETILCTPSAANGALYV
ncbi:MAG: PQQ-binding-like beta-propeller repeat protein, partial [Planctomycetota bacterium]|nr:PQQ-binding-like beta-propeller repeat protein [Planctomycetota bacterium]